MRLSPSADWKTVPDDPVREANGNVDTIEAFQPVPDRAQSQGHNTGERQTVQRQIISILQTGLVQDPFGRANPNLDFDACPEPVDN